MDTNEEKRRISRAACKVPALAKCREKISEGELIDFSLNGFLFKSAEVMDVAEEDKLTVIINLGDERQVKISEINCLVTRKNQDVLGLKFDAIDFDTLMLLKKKLIMLIGDEEKINDEFINFLIGN